MSLFGRKLLDNDFVQDRNENFIKIDNVVMGNSSQFGFKTVTERDIGKLLYDESKDESAVCFLYNWDSGICYVKTGFDLNNPDDYSIATGYTTFIVKSRADKFVNSQPTVPIVPKIPEWNGNNVSYNISDKVMYQNIVYVCVNFSHTSKAKWNPKDAFVLWELYVEPVVNSSGFVKVLNGEFILNGKPIKLVGPNAYWMGITEEYNYPPKHHIEEVFEATYRLSGNAIRSHTLGHSSGSGNSLRPRDNNLNEAAWDIIDYSYSLANKYNIKLVVPLTDCYKWYNGNYGDFCSTRGIPKRDFWTNTQVRSDFKKYVSDYLNHKNKYTGVLIKDDPALGLIELGNELGNIREGHHDSTTIPTKEWLTDISRYIKSIDMNHLILNPADECLGKSDDFNITTLDAHSGHFYWPDFNRFNYGVEECRKIKKPYIVGEYSSYAKNDWYAEMEKRNVQGSFFWSLYPHANGIKGGYKLPHDDGFTIHYSKDNESHLLNIANHFRRLQKLPQINSLNFSTNITIPEVTVVIPTVPVVTPTVPIITPPVAIITPPVPTVPIVIGSRDILKSLNNRTPLGAYFQAWSSGWASSAENLDLSKIENANIIYLSFVNPNCTYWSGQNTFAGTGLDFSSDFNVVKGSIKLLQNKGIIVILSVGGATYPFDTFNTDNITYLCKDLGCNGIDVDWEDPAGNLGAAKFGPILQKMRKSLGNELFMCSAAFSVGAYGQDEFTNSPPASNHTGMCIPGLKMAGDTLDWINIMSYDASPAFSPITSFDAYRKYYKGPLMIGCEVPPEAWGGNIVTLDNVKSYAQYTMTKGPSNGIFVWSYQKQGYPSCADILKTASSVYKNINSTIPVITPSAPVATPSVPVATPSVPVVTPTVSSVPVVYPINEWNGNFFNYKVGDIVMYNGISYTCRQPHASQSHWNPRDVLSLWEVLAVSSVTIVTPTVPSVPVVIQPTPQPITQQPVTQPITTPTVPITTPSTPVTTPSIPIANQTAKRCIYYHANWSTYARNYQIKDIPKEVTDISYAFFNLDTQGNVTQGDSWADSEKRFSDGVEPQDSWNDPGVGFYGNFGQIKKLQNSGRKLDVSLAIGGWTWSKNFSPAVSTVATRTNFVNNIISIFKRYTIFSGVSIDWEYVSNDGINYGSPGNIATKEDSENLALFLVELRNALSANGMSKYTIAMCTIADPNKCKFDLEKIHPLLSELHIMSYDFADGNWGETITRSHCNPRKSSFSNFSCEQAADYYLSRGVESTKLFIGVAFYSRGYSNTEKLGGPASGGSPDKSWDLGSVDYKQLPLPGATEYNDPVSKAAYSYDPVRKVINTYDNPVSVIEKCKIVYEKNLGGIIVWESSADYTYNHPRSLMKTLHDNLTNGRPKD